MLNANVVTEIAQKNDTAEQLFEYLKTRKRNARNGKNSVSSIKQQMILSGFSPAPQELLSTLRELDRAGVIELNGDHFRWKHQIREIKQALKKEEPVKKEVVAPQKILVVLLGKGRKCSVILPNVTTEEDINIVKEALDLYVD